MLLGYNKKVVRIRSNFVVPGGGIEPDESDLDALKREILEEEGFGQIFRQLKLIRTLKLVMVGKY